ncbi:MAG TPA: aldose epimerase family protein [Oculatellaceae cyanobacterium]
MKQALLEKLPFGTLPDGSEVTLFVLQNENGAQAKVTTYGAILTEFVIPDKQGQLANVVLGHDNLADYIKNKGYFGATVGRIANRIAAGEFTLEGTTYKLAQNDDRHNSLHGGLKGFNKHNWNATTHEGAGQSSVTFALVSKDGDEGFPGEVHVKASYTLTDDNRLIIDYEASTDRTTIINLTNHSYFNLDGAGAGDILDHELTIAAEEFTLVDDNLIPTGKLGKVEGTPLDFRKPKNIGAQIKELPESLGGYDHNFVLQKVPEGSYNVQVFSAKSGRRLRVTTTQPGMQLYCGNFLDGTDVGNGGPYYRYYGFCLETQGFPDAINHAGFPSTVLKKGETYKQQTVFDFNP